jgi:hypothetical protein
LEGWSASTLATISKETPHLPPRIIASFLANVNSGELDAMPLKQVFNLSKSFLLEMTICLVTLGNASCMLDTLGHPGDENEAASQQLVLEEGYLPAQRSE